MALHGDWFGDFFPSWLFVVGLGAEPRRGKLKSVWQFWNSRRRVNGKQIGGFKAENTMKQRLEAGLIGLPSDFIILDPADCFTATPAFFILEKLCAWSTSFSARLSKLDSTDLGMSRRSCPCPGSVTIENYRSKGRSDGSSP